MFPDMITPQHIMTQKPKYKAIHTVVHSDTHVYVDSFDSLYEANTFIDETAPEAGCWKVISKVIR